MLGCLPLRIVAAVLHQLKCKHKLGMFRAVLDLTQFIDPRQLQQQDEAQKARDAIACSVVGSVEHFSMTFCGHPLQDFLLTILPDKVIVQLKLRLQKHVMDMDSLVKGQFWLTSGKLFFSILLGQWHGTDVELW